jgi:hypothetical protein
VCLVDQVDLQVALLGVGAQVVLAHQAVEGDGAGRAGVALQVQHLGLLARKAPMSCSAAAVSSSGVPAGMSTTTWNSLLLSKGSIFSTTHCTGQAHRQRQRGQDAGQQQPALARAVQQGAAARGERRGRRAPAAGRVGRRGMPGPAACGFISLSASQGVTVKAIASDKAMPRLELMGIGLMYGPIRPLTKAIGSSAAITVSVARMVGPPTSSTATGMISRSGLPG